MGKIRKNPVSRSWCFTWFRLCYDEEKNLISANTDVYDNFSAAEFWKVHDVRLRCFIGQEEESKDGGEHYQMYAYSKDAKDYLWWKKAFGTDQIHCSITRKGDFDAATYCQKEESKLAGRQAWSYGIPPKVGERTDITVATDMLVEHKSMQAVATMYPTQYVLYNRGLRAFQSLFYVAKSRPNFRMVIFWGPTGTGKSTARTADHPVVYSAIEYVGNQWMGTSYDSVTPVFYEDFEATIPLPIMKRMCDVHPYTCDVKHSDPVPFNSELVIFTSNKNPLKWYDCPCWRRRVEDYADVHYMGRNFKSGVDMSQRVYEEMLEEKKFSAMEFSHTD